MYLQIKKTKQVLILIFRGFYKMKKLKKPKCPECGSSQVLYRKTDNKFWCRVCGAEWDKKKN